MFSKNSSIAYTLYMLAGALFGFGLAISGMNDTHVVKAFLDITGDWNYSLMFVMASAIFVTGIGYKFIFLQNKPLLKDFFGLPKNTKVDKPLILGSIIFGIGWGMYGYCPGPAIASLASLSPYSLAFVVSMAIGTLIAKRVNP